MSDELVTMWVRLRGQDLERAIHMKNVEKRSYASLIRIALDHYYYAHYEGNEELANVESA